MKSTFSTKKILQSLKFEVSKYFDKSLPDWSKIIDNKKSFEAKKKKKILIATSSGGLYSSLIFESVIGQALIFFGHEVNYLLCDKILSSCIMGSSFEISEDEYSKIGSENVINGVGKRIMFFNKK